MAEGVGLSSVLERPGDGTGRTAEPQPDLEISYTAFISYSHHDEDTAEWLQEKLESFAVPEQLVGRRTAHGPVPESLSPIFRDRGDLAAAADLGAEIQNALRASRYLIVLCSPQSARSRWTNEEIEAFRRLRPDGEIFAAILAGEPFASEMPGREGEECFPRALREHHELVGRTPGRRIEPIAADFRKHGDGKRVGFLKIVAGLIGIGLDQLVQRETVRRQRRLAMVAAASVLGMALTSSLAIVAVQARDEARDQRREAEGLVGFMLGDLRGTLEPIGRLDALDGVGSRVLTYYERQNKGRLTDEALAQRSRALTLLGEIASSRRDLDGALRRYREAMAGTAEALRRAPNNPQRLFDHAQNVFWVGEIARQRGNLDGAEEASREYQRLAARMIAIDPANPKWRMEGQYAATNLGIVLAERGQYAEATAEFQKALETIQRMAARDPRNMEFRKSLIELYAWLADARFGEGKLDGAIAMRERQIAEIEALMASDGGDVKNRQRLIPARRSLGRLLASRGDLAPAIEQLQTAVATGRRLMPAEPENLAWVEMTGGAELDLAMVQLAAGRTADATESARHGCDYTSRLVGRDRSVVEWQGMAIDCLSLRARLAMAAGSSAEALRLADLALSKARASRPDNPADRNWAVARGLRLVGDLQRRAGNRPAAAEAWEAALASLPDPANDTPKQTAIRAALLGSLGRTEQARPLAERLKAIGYVHVI